MCRNISDDVYVLIHHNTDRPATDDLMRQDAEASDNPSSGALDYEIEKLEVALSELRTYRDTLPPMSHMFDGEEEPNLTKRIEDVQYNLTYLKLRKNDLAVVSRLPEEIILAIISYAKWFPDTEYRYIHRMPQVLPQVWVCALVSKRWYWVVMSSPYMWNVVNASWSARKVKTWLLRSGMAKLYVWMNKASEDRDSTNIPELISTEVYRIRSLQIRTPVTLMDKWKEALDQDAPALEAFSLYVTCPEPRDRYCTLNFAFPAYFRGRPPPLLRELEFGGPHIIWTSPHLRNLNFLRIEGHTRPNRPRVPLAQVLRSLQCLQFLQYLEATDEAFPDDDNNPQNLIAAVLNLKSLRFEGGFERWCPLFRRLLLPFATEIELCSTSQYPSSTGTLFDHLTVYFLDETGSAGRRNEFDYVIMHQDHQGLSLQAQSLESTGRSPLRISIKYAGLSPQTTPLREEVYAKFSAMVPVSRATLLRLTGSMPTFNQWYGIQQAMGFLTVLQLADETCGSFPYTVSEDRSWSFTRLSLIQIENAPLQRWAEEAPYFWGQMARSIVMILQWQVGRRMEERLRIRFLACKGAVDVGFARTLASNGIVVEIL